MLDKYASHVVKDSFEFADLIRDHPTNEQTETFMCSFDVASLFTNVPIDETIEFYIWLNALYRSELQQPDIEEGLLKKCLYKSTKEVEFSFNNTMYRQVDGVAMGSPLGPVFANIFMGRCESLIPMDVWPDLYRRYMDDTFSLFPKEQDSVLFLDRLNGVHKSLTFTMESEKDGRLPFLDVSVIRQSHGFSTTVYIESQHLRASIYDGIVMHQRVRR